MGERLLAITPTRLQLDAKNTEQWRDKGFFPVLNERLQSPQNNLSLSPLYRLLELKRKNPTRTQGILPSSFDLELDRDQVCPKVSELEKFEKDHPLWGMPYGLPGLEENEFDTLKEWIMNGAKASAPKELSWALKQEVKKMGRVSKWQLNKRAVSKSLYL